MGLMDQIGSMFSNETSQGGPPAAAGQDQQQQDVHQMIGQANPRVLSNIFSHVARQMDPQEYANHVTPGAGGTNPLGSLGQGGLSTIASALLGKLMGSGAVNSGNILTKIPGLRTTDPNQMDEGQVASLSRYTQQNHPDVFGQAAAQVGQQQPSILNSWIGKAGMAIGAAALASHFIKPDRQ